MPMVAISGYITDDSTSVVGTLRSMGVTEILRKPIDRQSLETAVNNALHPAR